MRSRELAALRDEQSLELADHGGPGGVNTQTLVGRKGADHGR